MINIIDSIMGSGKTSFAIEMIKGNTGKSFIYITPFLSEVTRVKTNCNNFEEPEEFTDKGEKCFKLDSLHKLIKKGVNIVSTHALFKLTTMDTINLLKKQKYTLIIDEVLQVVDNENLKKSDLQTLLDSKLAHIDENNFLIWDRPDYDGAYTNIKKLCETKSVFVVNKVALVWVFPATIFQQFEDVWILTYLFSCQPLKYYFDLNGFKYNLFQVHEGISGYEIFPYSTFIDDKSNIKINIYDGNKNDNFAGEGDRRKYETKYFFLSHSWYQRASPKSLNRLKKNIYGYFKNDRGNSRSSLNMWTTFKNFEKHLKGKGYAKGFLPCNARARNDYRHKTNIAYLINIFMNPIIIEFFKINGITISKKDQERYALAELLQFLFRSAIRDNKEIYLYIPSYRMRQLLQQWLSS